MKKLLVLLAFVSLGLTSCIRHENINRKEFEEILSMEYRESVFLNSLIEEATKNRSYHRIIIDVNDEEFYANIEYVGDLRHKYISISDNIRTLNKLKRRRNYIKIDFPIDNPGFKQFVSKFNPVYSQTLVFMFEGQKYIVRGDYVVLFKSFEIKIWSKNDFKKYIKPLYPIIR